MTDTFSGSGYVGVYIFAVVVAGIHVSHGFWSAFQSIGANNAKYMPFIEKIGFALSIIVGFGFGVIPVYVLFFTQKG